MPNWCENTLNISGPKEPLKSFVDKAEGPTQTYNDYISASWGAFDEVRVKIIASQVPKPGEVSPLSFHALCPVPEDFRRFPYDDRQAAKLRAIVGDSTGYGGYNWEARNWGVKWGASDVNLTVDRGIPDEHNSLVTYEFSTPWGPPSILLDKVSKDFPDLNFELIYREEGMGFEGHMEWKSGKMTVEESWEIEEGEDYQDGQG
jgi:hypothetical protein